MSYHVNPLYECEKPQPQVMDKGEVNNNLKPTSNADLVTKVGIAALIPLAGAMSWLAAASTFITAVALVGTCFVVTLAESILFGFWKEKEIGAVTTPLEDGGYKVKITNTFGGPVKITAENGKIENIDDYSPIFLKKRVSTNPFLELSSQEASKKSTYEEELTELISKLIFRHEDKERPMVVTIECGEKREVISLSCAIQEN